MRYVQYFDNIHCQRKLHLLDFMALCCAGSAYI